MFWEDSFIEEVQILYNQDKFLDLFLTSRVLDEVSSGKLPNSSDFTLILKHSYKKNALRVSVLFHTESHKL